MRTAAWIMMLGVQIPVVLTVAYLFYRVMHEGKDGEKDDGQEK